MAGIIKSQNTRRPPFPATATQDYQFTVHKQVDRSCVPHCRCVCVYVCVCGGGGVTGKEGKEQRVWDKRREGGTETKHHTAGPSSPPGSKSQLFSLGILDICVSMTQIMFARTWKDCRRSKVVPSHSFFPTPQRCAVYAFPAMIPQVLFFLNNSTPLPFRRGRACCNLGGLLWDIVNKRQYLH